MAKTWSDDEVREEIRDAVRIVNEDREKAEYARLHDRYGEKPKEGSEQAPPPKEESKPEGEGKKVRKSLWFGEIEDE